MPRNSDEDLFESSKMSFGQHLDELRSALVRAVLALAIGVAIGLSPPVARTIVRQVQVPLKTGLLEYRKAQAEQQFEGYLEEREAAGDPTVEAQRELADAQLAEGLVPRVHLVDPQAVAAALAGEPPTAAAEGPDPGSLVPLTLYSPIDGGPGTQLIATNVLEGFLVYVKAALLAGAVLSSPVVFYYLWNFVASGLYQHERKYVYVFMPFSLGLFLAGAGLAFKFAIGFVLQYLFVFFAMLDIDPTPRIGEWISFVLLLPLGFGVAFQLPLVMLFLERIGVFSVPVYLQYWRVAVLVIFILSMILTPADPGSMLLLGVPLTGLYFGGVALCRFMPKRTTPFGEAIE